MDVKLKKYLFVFSLSFIVFIVYDSIYTVNIGEQVVVTQFNNILGQTVAQPGLHFKIPFVQKIHYLPNHRVFEVSDSPSPYKLGDGRHFLMEKQAKWEIEDPVKFFTNFGENIAIKKPIVQAIDTSLTEILEVVKLPMLLKYISESTEERKFMKESVTSKITKRTNQILNATGIKITRLNIWGKIQDEGQSPAGSGSQ